MIDLNSQFFAILTKVGEAKQANADALGIPWNISQMGVGDAHGTDPIPDRLQTKLINERRRAPLNQLMVDPLNPSVLIAEQVIPADVGGWWVREIGLYDADGDLVAVANCAPSFKPMLSQGSGRTQIVRMNFIISSITNVVLKIDPAIVLATREYVDRSIDTVLPADKTAGSYYKVTINKRGIVVSGSNPTTLKGFGITDGLQKGYLGLGGTTAEVGDIDKIGLGGGFHSFSGGESTFGNYVSVLNFPYITDDYSAQLGFKYSGDEPAILVRSAKSSGKWGNVRTLWHSGHFDPSSFITMTTGYTRPQVDGLISAKANWAITLAGYGINDAFTKIETTAAIQSAIAALVASSPATLDTLNELATALGNDPNFSTTVMNALAAKATKATTLGGYGIADAFTKTEVNNALANKADKDKALAVGSVSRQQPALAAPLTGSTYASSALIVREALESGPADTREIYAPGIGFHWLGQVAGKLVMDSIGKLKWNGLPLLTGAVASQEEVETGSTDTNVVTPFKMRFGFTFIKGGGGANNAIVLPQWLGGLMIQWGVHVANVADTETVVTFPLGFNIIPACVSSFAHDGATTQSTVASQLRSLTATGFLSRREDIINTSSFTGTAYIRWIAIGY